MKLHVVGPDAELRFYSAGPGPAASAPFMSALLGGAYHVKLLGWLIGDEIKLSSAATTYHKMISQEALTEIFPWPLSFSTALGPSCDFRVTFSSRYLQRPVVRTGIDLESLNGIDLLFALPPHVSVALAIRRIFLVALSRGVALPSTARLAALCNRSAATLRQPSGARQDVHPRDSRRMRAGMCSTASSGSPTTPRGSRRSARIQRCALFPTCLSALDRLFALVLSPEARFRSVGLSGIRSRRTATRRCQVPASNCTTSMT